MARTSGAFGARRRPLAAAFVILIAVTRVLLSPGVVLAHAAVVSSEPEPGSELGTAPGVVVLRFTEPLNVKLSGATVVAPDGTRFSGTATAGQEVRIPITTNAQGVYEVEWRTVSRVDGHTLAGAFRFGVGVSPGAGAEGVVGTAPQPADLLIALGRTVEYATLLLALGLFVLRRLARREPRLDWVRIHPAPVLAVASVSALIVVLGEALRAAPSPSAGAVVTYLTTGLPGVARLVRPILELTALVLVLLGTGLWVVPLTAALVVLAGAGHAAAVRPLWWGVTVDGVHLISAGVWAGGILALATVRPPGGWRSPGRRALLGRFSPVAVSAFVVTVGAGVLRGFQEVGHVGDLFSTSYGQVLLLKVLGVIVMTLLSVLAWRRRLGSMRLEAAVAVFVTGAAGLLAAYPLPPARVAEAERPATPAAIESALPKAGDLTLGGDAGQVLVGLALRPGTPGPNQAFVYLLPLDGEDAASRLRAELTVEGRTLTLQRCGPTCRRAEVDLQGGERVDVHVDGPTGGTASFLLPKLPASDGSAILQQMMTRIHELETYRLDETLSSGLAVVRARYAFQAPDSFESAVTAPSGGSRTVWIGGTRYLRQGNGPWQIEKGGPPPRVPSFTWDFFRPFIDARILGRGIVEGVHTQIVAFFGDSGGTPVWFRLWIDADGLVRRAHMRAQGHFMDHRYYDFGSRFRIEPPQVNTAE
ncbi:MAG: copper resistance CopC/CopD family protein [Actinomycetota bacterium]